MKKWFRFFFLGFFSHKDAKEGARHGYTSVFLAVALAMVFLWAGFIGGDMLPFGVHYNNSPDFKSTAYAVFANDDISKRIVAEIENGDLKVKKQGGEYAEILWINTFENDLDKQNYSVNGFNVVVDTRPADAIAEIEAYCISNDGKDTVISYQDYLTLSDVARLNFDFKLKYTGNVLALTDELVASYKQYVDGLSDENKQATEKLAAELAENKITKLEYNRAIYQLYFTNYYPEISAYESTSQIPLLRNYYYHEYLAKGANNYLLIFDDYVAGAFETTGGVDVTFYGFYSNLENGILVADGSSQDDAYASVDSFVQQAFNANLFLNAYAHIVNVFSFVPFVALMLMVVALLSNSLLKLSGVESVNSFGAMLKIVGTFVWFSALIGSVFAIVMGFFVKRSFIIALTLVTFFVALVVRSIVFVIKEKQLYKKQLEQQKTEQ